LAIKAFDDGENFPIWGTCVGFEMINYVISGFNDTVISKIDKDLDISHNVYNTKN